LNPLLSHEVVDLFTQFTTVSEEEANRRRPLFLVGALVVGALVGALVVGAAVGGLVVGALVGNEKLTVWLAVAKSRGKLLLLLQQ